MRVLRRLVAGLPLLALGAAALGTWPAAAQRRQGGEVNLYSSRHYDSDRALYDAFARRPASASA